MFMKPRLMPKFSSSTLAKGARQLVVQEALDTMLSTAGSYWSSFTPITMVLSTFLPGAEMSTFLAPASRCARALVPSVKKPVDSTTTSTPSSPQGSRAGSRSDRTTSSLPSTMMDLSVATTSSKARPWMDSYFSRWAMTGTSPRSLMATTSMEGSFAIALYARRPMRPKPLIPTFVAMLHPLSGWFRKHCPIVHQSVLRAAGREDSRAGGAAVRPREAPGPSPRCGGCGGTPPISKGAGRRARPAPSRWHRGISPAAP